MSNARNLSKVEVDTNGDIEVGSLGNVPPSNDASALTTGTLPTARLASGTVVQVDYGYYGGASVGINNTFSKGQVTLTLTRKLTNSKFLVISDSTIYRPSTSGWHYHGFYNVAAGNVWYNTKDATSWSRHTMHDIRTYAGNAGDSITFESANYNTANQVDQFQANSLVVMEIAP